MAAVIGLMVIAGGLGLYLTDVENRARVGFSDAQAYLGSSYERGLNSYERNPPQAANHGHVQAADHLCYRCS